MLAFLVMMFVGLSAIPAATNNAGVETLPVPQAEAPVVPPISAPPPRVAQLPPAAPAPVSAPLPQPLAAPSIQPPQPPAAPAPADAAAVREELQLWTQIKDSNRTEEIEAFLLAFPNGRLAPLARRRLDEIRRAATAPRPPAAPPVVAAPLPAPLPAPAAPQSPAQALMAPATPSPQAEPPAERLVLTRALITEIQEKLYSLNYYSGPINGNFGKLTSDAITAYQQRIGIQADGSIDPILVQRLRAAKTVDIWGAVAFSARGAWGASWGKGTRKIAETEAMTICRRNARTSCKIIATPGSACTALSVYDVRGRNGRRFWGAYVATRAKSDESRDGALEFCRRDSPSPDACQISVIVCGDKGQII